MRCLPSLPAGGICHLLLAGEGQAFEPLFSGRFTKLLCALVFLLLVIDVLGIVNLGYVVHWSRGKVSLQRGCGDVVGIVGAKGVRQASSQGGGGGLENVGILRNISKRTQ